MIQSLRNARFLARRSRKANMPARSSVSLADFNSRRRPPTNPLARLKITLPLAVTLNRFLTPLWVFILIEGMTAPLAATRQQRSGGLAGGRRRVSDCTKLPAPGQRQSPREKCRSPLSRSEQLAKVI